MAYTKSDLTRTVKEQALLNQSSNEFNTLVDTTLNTSLFRLSREANWRPLRRHSTIETVSEYTTGTGAVSVTNGSKSVSVTGATLLTDGVQIGRQVDLGGSTRSYKVKTITSETAFTVDQAFDGTTSTSQSYKIFGQEEYNLPIQTGRIGLLWHEDYGYPFVMHYVTDKDFYNLSQSLEDGNTPTVWRQWGSNNVLNQPRAASVIRISSSASGDTSKSVTVFGTVSGYPDYEIITTDASDGTTAVSGSKSFTEIERVVKDSSTTGRITLDANSANTTISVLPVGDSTGSVEYKKIQIFPYATRVFPIHVEYYKDPWRLVNDGDIHELGHQFDEALILLTVAKLNYGQGKTKEGDKFLTLYTDEVRNLRKDNADKITNWTPSLRSPRESRMAGAGRAHRFLAYSQLGGSYGPIWR